jgi:hypothetical protein
MARVNSCSSQATELVPLAKQRRGQALPRAGARDDNFLGCVSAIIFFAHPVSKSLLLQQLSLRRTTLRRACGVREKKITWPTKKIRYYR